MLLPENILVPFFFKLNEKISILQNLKNNKPRTDILLVGQGWFAKGFMEHIDKNKFKITNIYRNEFINTPMLLQTVKPEYKGIFKLTKNTSNFTSLIDLKIKDEINKIDLSNNILYTKKCSYSWKNGYLVCGLGSNTDNGQFWNLKIEELKKINVSQKICIVGAGPTGTELAFHLKDLNHDITLYDGLPDVYNYLTPYGKNLILNRLSSSNIKLFTNKIFSDHDKKLFDQVIFATGSRANDLTSKFEINDQLNVINYTNIYVGGDGIYNKNLPRNAQVAYEQGKYIALKLNGVKVGDFKFKNKGIALYIGDKLYYTEILLFNKIYCIKIPDKIINIYYNLFK